MFSNINLISELLYNFGGIELLTLSETHIQQANGDEVLYDVPGYSFTSRPWLLGKGGGLGAYISEKINWDRRDDLEDEKIEVMRIEIWPKFSRGLLIGVVYRPPATSKHLNEDFNEFLNLMLSKASEKKKEIIILGDMNTNFLAPGDSKDFESTFDIFGFQQMVEKPTRITTTTQTLIDVILTNNPANISKIDASQLA